MHCLILLVGFPRSTSDKELTCQYRRLKRPWFSPWVRKIPWRRAWQPTPIQAHESTYKNGFCYFPRGGSVRILGLLKPQTTRNLAVWNQISKNGTVNSCLEDLNDSDAEKQPQFPTPVQTLDKAFLDTMFSIHPNFVVPKETESRVHFSTRSSCSVLYIRALLSF